LRAKRDLRVEGQSVRWQLDRDYWAELRTTFGTIVFPWFAAQLEPSSARVTQTPAWNVFPGQQRCRSSQLCLELITRID